MIKALFNRRTALKAALAIFVLGLTAWLPLLPTPAQAAGPVTAHWFERATFQISGGNLEDSNFVYNPEDSTDSSYFYQGTLKFKSSAPNKCKRSGLQIAVKKSDLTKTTQSTKVDSAAYATWDNCSDSETDAIRDALNNGNMKVTDAGRLVESYKWINDRTILADGGYLKGKGIEFLGGTGTSFSLASTGMLEDGCVMGLVISNINAARTSATIKKGDTISSGDQKTCSAELQSRFNNKTITIADADRSDDALDDASTRTAVVTVRPKHNIPPLSVSVDDERTGNVPQTDTVKLTKQGESVAQQTLTPPVNLAFDYHSSGVWYTASFTNVQPGTYTACSAVAFSCVTFEKKQGEIARADINGQNTAIEPTAVATDTTADVACGGNFFLRWLVCPFMEMLSGAVDTMFNDFIKPILRVSPLTTNSGIYPVWEQFRNLTNVLFVLLFLVIIFSNAITQIDAYTVKKALPRLVAAAVLVQASFFICAIVIDIGNVLGSGIGSLIGQAINIPSTGGISNQAQNIAGGLQTILIGGSAGLLAYLSGAWIFMLPIALATVISIITFVLTLIMRQLVLNILIVVSPIAVLAWVLPNTEKFFKQWWGNFLKLVMMFPLIVLMMGMAKLLADIGKASLQGGSIENIISMFAPIVAFIAIPSTFKMSGMLMSKVSGAVQQRGAAFKGRTVEPLRKSMRENVQAKNAAELGKGNMLRRGIARVGSGNAFSFGTVGRRKMAATQGAAEAAIEKDNNEILRKEAPTNAALWEAWKKGEVGGKKMDALMRRATLNRLMANKGAPEYAKLRETVEGDDGNFDATKAAKGWGVSEREASLVWNNAHEGANGGWAVSNGFRPDGFKGVDAADVSTFAGYRQERIKNFIDRKVDPGSGYYDPTAAASMMANIANDYDARAKVSRDAMIHLKNVTTLGHPDYNADLASQVVEINGNKMTMSQYAANHIDDHGSITVPQPPSGGATATLGPTPPTTPVPPTPAPQSGGGGGGTASPSPTVAPTPSPGSATTAGGIVVPPARRTRAPRPIVYTPTTTTSEAAINNASDRMEAAIAAGDEQLRQTNVRTTSQAYENTGATPPQPTPESIEQINQNLAPGTVIQPSVQPDDDTPPTT